MKRKHEKGDVVKVYMQTPMTIQEFTEGEALLIEKLEENETHEKWKVCFLHEHHYYERWVKK